MIHIQKFSKCYFKEIEISVDFFCNLHPSVFKRIVLLCNERNDSTTQIFCVIIHTYLLIFKEKFLLTDDFVNILYLFECVCV